MAFAFDDFMKIVGAYCKATKTIETSIADMVTAQDAIGTAYENAGISELFSGVPGIFASIQASQTSGIASVIQHLASVLFTDRDYVIEQLPTFEYGTSAMLGALLEYMNTNNKELQSSVVTLGGTDIDFKSSTPTTTASDPLLFVGRTLDAVNSPGNGVVADSRYLGLESQLARPTTMYAEVISATVGQEVAQIYSSGPATPPFVVQDEEPGVGPTIINPEAVSLFIENYNFSSFTGNTPNGWTVSGGADTTDWVDASGLGAGPWKVKTNSVKAVQQLVGLTKGRMYFAGVSGSILRTGASTTGTFQVKVRNGAETTTYLSYQTGTPSTGGGSVEHYGVAFGFFYLPDSANENDVYIEINVNDAADSAGEFIKIRKAVVAPAFYYNGLAIMWWPHVRPTDGTDTVGLRDRVSMAIAYSSTGVAQQFFRKAFNMQLRTADSSPDVADADFTP